MSSKLTKITNPKELEQTASEASRLLQMIQDYAGRTKNEAAKVAFPRGWIRKATEYRKTLPNNLDEHTRRNLSYALITTDIFRWLAVRTDLSGTGLEMVTKEGICLLGSICETLTVVKGAAAKKVSFLQRTKNLVDKKIITIELKEELDWVWKIRKAEHVMDLESAEFGRYKRDDYNRALKACKELREALCAMEEIGNLKI